MPGVAGWSSVSAPLSLVSASRVCANYSTSPSQKPGVHLFGASVLKILRVFARAWFDSVHQQSGGSRELDCYGSHDGTADLSRSRVNNASIHAVSCAGFFLDSQQPIMSGKAGGKGKGGRGDKKTTSKCVVASCKSILNTATRVVCYFIPR